MVAHAVSALLALAAISAHAQAAVYRWIAAQKERCEHPAFEEREAVRREPRETVVQQWADHLAVAESGRRTLDALAPTIERWLERPHGYLSFHLVQVLTGHGCFGSYLHRIGREETPSCHACRGGAEDTAHHTLAVCAAWAPQRNTLIAAVGRDLVLPSIVKAMLDSNEAWVAMASFCEDVMCQKEAAEREREDDPNAPSLRRRHYYDDCK
ncbi:uncharacterized protein LOC114351603 [Ostrinia furnacalis]|uniref:uncharacterized protein LOC114351603 n=1 Tax=Ostrinia furnacalis TaxID=93504 RepID=UPI00103B2CF5|nr:uncharacterized protein LOC114351603 [Ostrinia furnacalis]